ncbi:glycosyltransferase [Microvirga arabica]|uniref:Glycosyltransferase n=1 Tax=Microvirga arabica TaxID=1128671 RepID=A0ABV6YBX2_9HYPH
MVENFFHASIILNIHREAVYLRRTLLSLDEAVRFAQAKGLRLELVAVLDQSDDATRHVLSSFDLGSYSGVQFIDVDHGSLGLSRNAGIEQARGEYIFTADADDLVSYNYFRDIYVAAQKHGPGALYFPEYLMIFDHDTYIGRYAGLDDVSPMAFLDKQPYLSRVCARRDVFLRIPYRDVRLSRGYAYEDWHFNAEAVGAGLNIRTVSDTILFYRQRPGSLLRSADALSIRHIPPTRLLEPSVYLALSKAFHDRFLTEPSPELFTLAAEDFLSRDHIQAKIRAANAIEPAISPGRYRDSSIYGNFMGPPPLGMAYYRICDIIQTKRFSDVFLFPFMSRGGAEKYLLSLMETMYGLDPLQEFLVLLGEGLRGSQWLEDLPPNAVVVDMEVHCRSLSKEQRCLLALKIIETCDPGISIHLRQSAFADTFLKLYGIVLQDRDITYYRFADVDRVEYGRSTTVASQVGLLSENLDYLSRIICDSKATIRKDHHRLGLQDHKWHHLHAPVEGPAILPVRDPEAVQRILWASRLDTEKRPSLLPLIAARLGRHAPDARIEAFGGSVFDGFDSTSLENLTNLRYAGPYDGFDTLPLHRFCIFLYTSLHDGIPNAILEAMSHGLAVVAPDVGGISEIVVHGKTGILLPSLPDDDTMAISYADALLTLMNDPDLLQKLGRQARAFVEEHHSPEAHRERVAELFRFQQRHFQYA